MYLSQLHINNFRNYIDLHLNFSENGAIFIGENGSGKTSILEAICFLCIGRSQRNAHKKDMIHHDSHHFFIEACLSSPLNTTSTAISIGFSKNNKIILKKNNQEIRLYSEFFSQINLVSFGTNDISLVYGEPTIRRKMIDMLLCRTDTEYMSALLAYKKALYNRNMLLQKHLLDDTFELYEEQVATHGAIVIYKRCNFIQELSKSLSSTLPEFYSDIHTVSIKYINQLVNEDGKQPGIRDNYLHCLHSLRKKDCAVGFTTFGPHRDDFLFYMNNKPIKTFGSQGQCRSMVVSIKINLLSYLKKRSTASTIILVDDAFSELDEVRIKKALFLLYTTTDQFFITSLPHQRFLPNAMQLYKIENNNVKPV